MDAMARRPDPAGWTDEACREWLWRRRHSPDGGHADCPSCGRRRRFHPLAGRPVFSCDACGRQLSPTAGTLFHGSSTSLALWFRAVVFIAGAAEQGETVSIRRLAADLDLSYATARRMRERILAGLGPVAASGFAGAAGSAQPEAAGSGVTPDAASPPDARSADIVRRIVREYQSGSPGWADARSARGEAGSAGEGGDEAGVALRPAGRATRERILDATCRVIVDKGMAAVRVGDIAREAGLSTAIVHYHFATKDEVLLEAVVWQNARETARRDAIVAGAAPPIEKLLGFLAASMPPHGFARDEALIRYDLWGRAMREPAYRDVLMPLRNQWRRQIVTILEEGVAGGAFRLAHPFDEVVEEFTAILDGYSLQFLLGYRWMTAERMWELLGRYVQGHLGVPAEVVAERQNDSASWTSWIADGERP